MSDFLTKQERKSQKQNCEKNYAPVRPLGPSATHIAQLYSQRQSQREAIRQHVTPRANLTEASKILLETRARKLRNRKAYEQRVKTRDEKLAKENTKENIDLSKIRQSDMLLMRGNFTEREILHAYNAHHRCVHKFRFNAFSWITKNQKPYYMIPKCEHQDEMFKKDGHLKEDCKNCGNKIVNHIIRDKCNCLIKRCPRCKYQTYYWANQIEIWCHCTTSGDVGGKTYKYEVPVELLDYKNRHAGEENIRGTDDTNIKTIRTAEASYYDSTHDEQDWKDISKLLGNVSYADKVKQATQMMSNTTITVPPKQEPRRIPKPIQIRPQGGCISNMTSLSPIERIKEAITGFINKVKESFYKFSFYSKLHDYGTSFIEAIKSLLKSIARKLQRIYDYILANPQDCAILCLNILPLLTQEFTSNSYLNIATICILFSKMCVSKANNSDVDTLTEQQDGEKWMEFTKEDLTYKTRVSQFFSTYFNYFKSYFSATDETTFSENAATVDSILEQPNTLEPQKTILDIDVQGFNFKFVESIILSFCTLFKTKFTYWRNLFFSRPLNFSLLQSFNTAFSAARNCKTILLCFLNFLPKFLYRFLCRSDPRAWLQTEMTDESSEIRQLITDAITIERSAYIVGDKSKIESLRTQAAALHAKLYSDAATLGYLIDRTVTEFFKTTKQMIFTISKPTRRECEPFIIKMFGTAGVGKSSLVNVLLSAIDPKLKTNEDVDKVTFVRNSATDFWDGCTPDKRFIIYDDFGQDREEIDLREIIGLGTKSAYFASFGSVDPKMAELTGVKGQTVHPEAIILLSNRNEIIPVTLSCPDALNRRKHMNIKAEFAPGFNKTSRKKDFSHMRLSIQTNLGSDMPETWDIVTIPQLLKKINTQYNSFRELNVDLDSQTESFFFSNQIELQSDVDDESIKRIRAETKDIIDTWFNTLEKSPKEEPTRTTLEKFKALPSFVYSKTKSAFSNFSDFIYRFFSINWLHYIRVASTLLQAAFTLFITFLAGIQIYEWMTRHKVKRQSGEAQTVVKTVQPVKLQSGFEDIVPLIEQGVSRVVVAPHGSTTQVFFVRGRTFLANQHLFIPYNNDQDFLDEGTECLLYTGNVQEPYVFKFCRQNMVNISTGQWKDLVLYTLPATFPSRKDMLKHFWNGDVSLSNRQIMVFPCSKPDAVVTQMLTTLRKTDIEIEYHARVNGKYEPQRQHQTYTYQFAGQNGNCGMIAALVDPSWTEGRIVGIHCGIINKYASESIGLLVTRDMLQHALDRMETQVSRVASQLGYIQYNQDTDLKQEIEGHTIFIGKAKILGSNTKTKIRPSILHDQITQHTTIPAILSSKDPRLEGVNFLKQNINKFSNISTPFEQRHVDRALKSIKEELFSIPTISINRKLTLDEAINGMANMPYIDGLDMTTSPGFPYVYTHRGKKSLLFTFDGVKYTPRDFLLEGINTKLEHYKNGEILDEPFIEFLKDERLPIDKVLVQKKTRCISSCPLHLCILSRMYFLPFVAHLYQARNKCFSSVGIVINSLEWDQHVKYLKEVGDKGFDGDYKGWDGSVSDQVMIAFYRLMSEYFVDSTYEDNLVRECISEEARHSLHILRDTVFQKQGGNPSGLDVTTALNTVCNEMYMRIAWQNLVPPPFNSLFYYRKHVRTSIYGDDNNVVVADPYLKFFNQITLAKFLETHNIKYTNAHKTAELKPYYSIHSFSFLKNDIGTMYGKYVPIMDESANLETLNWIRDNGVDCPKDLTQDNCNCVLRVAFFRGKQYFNRLREQILCLQPDFNLITFSELRSNFLQTGVLTAPGNEFGFTRVAETGHPLDEPQYTRPVLERQLRMIIPYEEQDICATPIQVIPQMDKQTMNQEQSIDKAQFKPISTMGVTLAEQAVQEKIEDIPNEMHYIRRRATRALPEEAWDLSKMLARKSLLTTVNWPSTAAQGDLLYVAKAPLALLANELMRTPFRRFLFFRCDTITVYATIAASRFFQGRALMSFFPCMSAMATENIDFQRAYTMEKAFIDPAQGTTVQLKIPFKFFKPWLRISDETLAVPDVLGYFFIHCFNPFLSAIGSPTSVSIKLFVSIENAEFKVPAIDVAVPVITQMGLLTDMAASATGVPSGVLQPLANIAKKILPDNIVGDVIGGLLDKPQISDNPAPLVRKDQNYLSHAVNIDNIDRLTLDPSAIQEVDEEHFATEQDEMNINYIATKKPAWIGTYQWLTTDPVGAKIAEYVVGPWGFRPPPKTTDNAVFLPLVIDWLSLPFTYWKGGFYLIIDVVGTQFHEGRLDVTYNPQIPGSAPASYSNAVTQYLASFAVRNGESSFKVRIPFVSDTAWKRVATQIPSTMDISTFNECFCGSVTIFVSVPLKAPNTVVPQVAINVFVGGDEDYQLTVPNFFGQTFRDVTGTGSVQPAMNVRVQSGTLDLNEPNTSDMDITLGTREDFQAPDTFHFGETYTSLRDILKRYSPVIRYNAPFSETEITNLPFNPVVRCLALSKDNTGGAIAWLSAPFLMFRGTMCYKIRVIPDVTAGPWTTKYHGWVSFVSAPPREQTPTSGVPSQLVSCFANNEAHTSTMPIARAYFSDNQTAEFAVPYTSMYDTNFNRFCVFGYYNAPTGQDQVKLYNAEYYQNLIIAINTFQAQGMRIDIDMSIGDEAHYGVWMGVPKMHYRNQTNVTQPNWPAYWETT